MSSPQQQFTKEEEEQSDMGVPGETLARVPPSLQNVEEGIRQPCGQQLDHHPHQVDTVKLCSFMAGEDRAFGFCRAVEDGHLCSNCKSRQRQVQAELDL